MTPLAWAAIVLSALIVGSGIDLLLGVGRLRRLSEATPITPAEAPRVSIVVAARDEARGIEAGLRSLLAQEYPGLEIIVVDDRSTDGTGPILDRLAAEDARIRPIHVTELPEGWLGKNHALAVGARAAQGEWLLFADADVVMARDAVARAVGYAEREGRDHLAVLPVIRVPGLLGGAFVTAFVAAGSAALRPWKARDPGSRTSLGVGAFNLVRQSAYRRIGGHESIRMRPDDDLKLAHVLKRSGARTDVLLGSGLLRVDWYHSIPEAVHGLSKNTFSVVGYRVSLMLLAALLYLAVALGPLAALVLGHGAVRWIGAVAVAAQVLAHLRITRDQETRWWSALLYPVGDLILAWIVVRTLVVNLVQGGIVWRGTRYPLSELRKNRV